MTSQNNHSNLCSAMYGQGQEASIGEQKYILPIEVTCTNKKYEEPLLYQHGVHGCCPKGVRTKAGYQLWSDGHLSSSDAAGVTVWSCQLQGRDGDGGRVEHMLW